MYVHKLDAEKGSDGWWRTTIGTYYSGMHLHRDKPSVEDKLKEATGCEWKFFGCFMDLCCWGTREEPPANFEIELSWKG